jgi:glutathione S-transferase
MYTLHYSPGSASFVVHQTLLESGAPYELARVDLQAGQHKTPEYLALNPCGVVPTLIVDGRPHYESAALVMLIADRHPDAKLAPAVGTPERDVYTQWIVHMSNALMPMFRMWFYPAEPAGEEHVEKIKAFARGKIEAVFDRLDAHLATSGGYVTGTFSAADLLALMLMRWSRNMPKPATSWPRLADYAARLKRRPSFAKLYELEGLTEWA